MTGNPDSGGAELSKLANYIERINAGQSIAAEEYHALLDTCEAYECWQPMFKIIDQRMATKTAEITDYVRLARAQNLFMSNPKLASETCALALSTIGFDFNEYREKILARVVDQDDWKTEAMILQACLPLFKNKQDQIDCLERLCLIYEKKIHNDQSLEQYYSQLLNIDAKNTKALRYFKLVFTQNEQWDEVAHVLLAMIDAASHPNDRFRSGQELAAVYLYQLDRPKEALETIDRFCADSPLDKSTIQYDAFQRMGDMRGCLSVLNTCLKTATDDNAKATLLHKIALHEKQAGDLDAARGHFVLAKDLRSHFYEPFEQVVEIDIQKKNWQQVQSDLDDLAARVSTADLRDRVVEAKKRLSDCLNAK